MTPVAWRYISSLGKSKTILAGKYWWQYQPVKLNSNIRWKPKADKIQFILRRHVLAMRTKFMNRISRDESWGGQAVSETALFRSSYFWLWLHAPNTVLIFSDAKWFSECRMNRLVQERLYLESWWFWGTLTDGMVRSLLVDRQFAPGARLL